MSGTPRPRAIVPLAIAFEGALLVLALGVGRLVGVPALETLRLSAGGLAWGLVATLPLLGALWWFMRSRWAPLVKIRREMDRAVSALFAGCSVAQLGLVALAAGVGEEVLFRGLLQPGIAGVAGTTTGLLVASVVFGLCHLVTPAYAVLAALLGGYLGWLAIAADNLLAPITAHAAYDFIALLYWRRTRRAPSAADGSVPLD
jgi:membrane protease YdiL (CAAX protease family)